MTLILDTIKSFLITAILYLIVAAITALPLAKSLHTGL